VTHKEESQGLLIQDPKRRVSVSLGCYNFDRSFMLVPAIASFFSLPSSHVGSKGVYFASHQDRKNERKVKQTYRTVSSQPKPPPESRFRILIAKSESTPIEAMSTFIVGIHWRQRGELIRRGKKKKKEEEAIAT
jgi:hypothetical protein